ncbi:hypothetical protein CC1G_10138 [Coprinopsis cinerea okayama7|uniref:CxC2-like cysteine cluster KDZ transposase-associated domain-containing protein n=1 Tax=Coprinopsis cinerea (strain Okayama-7 / 130 / ATCC MYA-4618 / FGSC 9003) TaxID=240176 RepID=A8N3Z9_COPC7|nr:hypothetical protein CC1G_10138 [Coprinopsis cinerea okayama7\|eukprot:XP_001829608.2 hypothetical protein CC1G_10138 [Coprinopsis cinerea okayama7\
MAPKKRRIDDHFEFYEFDDPVQGSEDVQEKYTEIESTGRGYRASDSYLVVPPSPTKKSAAPGMSSQQASGVSNQRVDIEALFAENFAVDLASLDAHPEEERTVDEREGQGKEEENVKAPRDQLPMLSFTSKASAYEFMRALERRTDNSGTEPVPNRYPSFLRMVHIWRHIRMMKRAGRGHSLSGVHGTSPGECALLCPACPYPDINLPSGWNSVADYKWFVYRLFLAIDANFRLRRKDVSSDARDPGLNRGYAYMVDDKDFRRHLAEFDADDLEEKSTCSNHDAIKSASIRGGKGIAVTTVHRLPYIIHVLP